jgi:hypothetical protein
MTGCSPSSNVLLAAVLSGLLVATASCGDFQDPASGAAGQSGLSEAELMDQSADGREGKPAGQQDGQTSPSSALSALALAAAASPGETRSVTLSWDPSENVTGYKVYLILVSTTAEQIIDVGMATELTLPLKIGETYGFTVTAYNASMESHALPYVLFHVFANVIG